MISVAKLEMRGKDIANPMKTAHRLQR